MAPSDRPRIKSLSQPGRVGHQDADSWPAVWTSLAPLARRLPGNDADAGGQGVSRSGAEAVTRSSVTRGDGATTTDLNGDTGGRASTMRQVQGAPARTRASASLKA